MLDSFENIEDEEVKDQQGVGNGLIAWVTGAGTTSSV